MRAERSLIQTIGRAARNAGGKVIMYADTVTGSMAGAIRETNRRRAIQSAYNAEHGITPKTVVKGIRDVIEIGTKDEKHGKTGEKSVDYKLSKEERERLAEQLTQEMKAAARELEFEKAAYLRDRIAKLRVGKIDDPFARKRRR